MIWAILTGSVITNIIIADEEFVTEYYPAQAMPLPPNAGIGWRWNGSTFDPPPSDPPADPGA